MKMMSERKNKVVIIVAFAIYIVLLFVVYYGLSGNSHVDDVIRRNGLFSNRVINIFPFKNILRYIVAIFDQSINFDIILHNIVSPLIAWSPSGLFGYCLFNKYKFSVHIIFFVLFQVVFLGIRVFMGIGYFDIDKIILSIFTYVVGYVLLRSGFRMNSGLVNG